MASLFPTTVPFARWLFRIYARPRRPWPAGRIPAAILAASLAAPAPPLAVPSPPRQKPSRDVAQQEKPIRVGVDLVNVFATVREKNKRIVTDLTQADFRVWEDGTEQKIEFFSRETAKAITLGLLIDTSGSQGRVLGAEQAAASRFLRRVLRKGDQTFVISFDLDVDLLCNLTEDQAQLERAIQRTRINAPSAPPMVQGPFPQRGPLGTDFYDAVYLASREILSRETGRRALVVLTDAQDYGSKVRLQDALEAAQRADTVAYVILISDVGYYAWGQYGGEAVAKKLAEETGGRIIEAKNEKQLDEAFDQLADELRSQYLLSYYPTNKAHEGKFRRIKVETTRSGLKVLARKGYYEAGSKP